MKFTMFLFLALSTVIFSGTGHAQSQTNNGPCHMTLMVETVQSPIVLGGGSSVDSINQDITLSLTSIDETDACAPYKTAKRFKMNDIKNSNAPALIGLKEGDIIEGGIMQHAPSPHHKSLHAEYHHGFVINNITRKRFFISKQEQLNPKQYFRHIGVFKD